MTLAGFIITLIFGFLLGLTFIYVRKEYNNLKELFKK